MSVLFAVVVASFHARVIFMTDGGDNHAAAASSLRAAAAPARGQRA
jgi:hypothetical protein